MDDRIPIFKLNIVSLVPLVNLLLISDALFNDAFRLMYNKLFNEPNELLINKERMQKLKISRLFIIINISI